jgi:holo-ACP synthase CitX
VEIPERLSESADKSEITIVEKPLKDRDREDIHSTDSSMCKNCEPSVSLCLAFDYSGFGYSIGIKFDWDKMTSDSLWTDSSLDSSLQSILDAREERWRRRLVLSRNGTLLTMTLNLPGPDKQLPRWLAFRSVVHGELVCALADWGFGFTRASAHLGAAGPEDHFLFPPSVEPESLKRAAVDFEEHHRAGRLVDLDVMVRGGRTVGRDSLEWPPRLCLCCSHPAKECAALSRHSADEVMKAAERLLDAFENFPR